mmetsp:Transcript_90451/g.264692  ORF Transcript_90451/g.264692 Transcript_90451/m.264692 type:complete len:111 (-) Transcript_90451:332-664(-)
MQLCDLCFHVLISTSNRAVQSFMCTPHGCQGGRSRCLSRGLPRCGKLILREASIYAPVDRLPQQCNVCIHRVGMSDRVVKGLMSALQHCQSGHSRSLPRGFPRFGKLILS